MPTGDLTHRPAGPLRKLRSRWFAPSRPLAVDDEPLWSPARDVPGDAAGSDYQRERERPAAPDAAP